MAPGPEWKRATAAAARLLASSTTMSSPRGSRTLTGTATGSSGSTLPIGKRSSVRSTTHPPGLEELRAVLLQEHVGRKRDGLV